MNNPFDFKLSVSAVDDIWGAESSFPNDPPLLAKPEITWIEHTLAVSKGAISLAPCIPHVLNFAKLEDDPITFQKLLFITAFFHDLGKIGSHFNQMIQHNGDYLRFPQTIRHEYVSSLILLTPEFQSWLQPLLEPNFEKNLATILVAIQGHHRKTPPVRGRIGRDPHLHIPLDHPQVQFALEKFAHTFNLQPPPHQPLTYFAGGLRQPEVYQHMIRVQKFLTQTTASFQLADHRRTALLAALLINADVFGSIAQVPSNPIFHRLQDSLSQTPGNLLDSLVQQKIQTLNLHPFQQEMASIPAPRALCIAGTGLGKTLAALLWARNNAPNSKVFICYPTMGTASEGFRDYLDNDLYPDLVDVLHSQARFERDHSKTPPFWTDGHLPSDQEITRNALPHEPRQETIRRLIHHQETEARNALDVWRREIVTCTVDTVLGFLQFQRRGTFALPSLANAAIIFDEAHAYPYRTWKLMLSFLRDFNTPALVMTASLSQQRIQELQEVTSITTFGYAETHDHPMRQPRYQIHQQNPTTAINDALESQGKILWISNTVQRTINHRLDYPQAICLHSNFRAPDRRHNQQRIIEGFRKSQPILAVTTQVAEMSLNISASLLITELAPIPALIQRLGRLNRFLELPNLGQLLILLPGTLDPLDLDSNDPIESPNPYSQEELHQARSWLRSLPQPFSQQDLVDHWHQTTDREEIGDYTNAYSQCSTLYTRPMPVRDDTPKIHVVLPGEESFEEMIPMSYPPESIPWRSWPRNKNYYYRADPRYLSYDPDLGGQWNAP